MVVKSLQSCGQQLPPKENALFKRLVKCYELKQYKNGLKFAKQILSNPSFADHGETLAMKGLLLCSLGKKAEAYSAVDKGLRKNLASIVCWQAYAILHKNDRKYEEAIKGYKLALNRDNNNLEILRDLSVLQVHTRDFDGFLKTRGKILLLQPGLKASWITHAVAFHLLKDYDMALKTLEEFRKTYPVKQFDFEHSEVLLYQNFVMREAGLETEALQHLATYESQIVDKLAVQEIRAKMLLSMKDKEAEAISVCEQLLHRNPDNGDYYTNVELARHPATLEERLELYRSMSEKYPRAMTPKLLMFEFISGELFRSEVDNFLVRYLRKGVPPLFKILRSLYSKTEKVEVIEKLVLGYLENLKQSNSFYSNDSQESEEEAPTSLLWTYFYLAQHYDFLDQTEKAFEYIDLALGHTMTLIELYVVKAKICKHAGDINDAVRCLDEAQSLDTADRYVNSKCAKYMMRANMLKEAENLCSKFTKEGNSAAETLHEMQCMWFLLESAALYRRTGQYGEALKKCHEIARHFNEIVEDQFDFHMYCMRKSTIRGYVEILRFEDVLKSHPNYFRAATMAIEIYLHLFDCAQSEAGANDESNQENLTPAELKKLRDKQRKKAKKEAAEKQKQEEIQRAQQRNKSKNYDPELDGPAQEELKPEKLAKPENPLEEALVFLRTLQQFASNRIETHILAFKIFQRKGKLLLMLQSIKRAFAIEPNNPQVHECLIQFLKAVENRKSLPGVAEKVLLQELVPICGEKVPATVNAEFLAKNGNSLPHLLSGAKMIYYLDPSKKSEAVNIATNLSPDLTGLSLKTCSSVLEALCNGDFGKCEIEAEDYRTKCRAVFPRAVVFSLTPAQNVVA